MESAILNERQPAHTLKPRVAVIIPAYNAERTIERTLASSQNQTYGNLEIVVVDDGSWDFTTEIVRTAAIQDSRIKLIIQKNAGVAAARNAGLAAAQSEYVAFLDSDDLWHPTKIEKQMNAIQAKGDGCGFVYSLYREIDPRDVVIRNEAYYGCDGSVFFQHLLVNFVGNGSSILSRRSTIIEHLGYTLELRSSGFEGCEDILLQLRIANEMEVCCVREYLVGYRRSETAMSSDRVRMTHSWELAIGILGAEVSLPRTLLRWARGAQHRWAAWGEFSLRNRRMQAAAYLNSAFALDPVGTAYAVSAQLIQWLGRCVYADYPESSIGRTFHTLHPLEGPRAVPKLTARRLARLSKIEELRAR